MEKISSFQDIQFVKFTRAEDIERIDIQEFSFFKGFGIIDYHETFKAWLRKFPKPIFLGAVKGRDLIGWVYIDEWKEGTSSDGNSIYVLRAIETRPSNRGKRIGTKMVVLGLQQTIGYMIVKPVNPEAEEFFAKNGFMDYRKMTYCPVNLDRHPGYFILTPSKKKGIIKKFNELDWQSKPIFIEKEKQEIEESYDWESVVPEFEPATFEPVSLKIFYHPMHLKHFSSTTSPENPQRLVNIFEFLSDKVKIFEGDINHSNNFYKVKEKDLLLAHSKKYLEFVKSYSHKGGGFLGDDTYFNKDTYEVCLNAVGGAISDAMTVINGEMDHTIALIRPPGHHASKEKHGGFCIFNNAAITARYIQEYTKKKKILILDWDAHAANGTQDIFYADPNVLLISIHQSPQGFYPNTGFTRQLGKGDAVGRNINIELPKGSGNNEFRLVFKEIVEPVIMDFDPDFAVCCCGFDPYYRDSLTQLNLTAQGFFDIATFVNKHFNKKACVILEGGYHQYCDKLSYVFINGLLGRPLPYIETIDPLQISATTEEKIRKKIKESIREMKMILEDYYKI